MAVARFWSPFLFLALVPAGFWLGGAWSFLLVAALPLALTSFDWLFGEEPPSEPPERWHAHRLLP